MQGTLATLDQPDRSLVEMARDGNKDAFGELIRRHYRRCIELSNLFLRNRCDAEDQVQIACSKAYVRLNQFHGDSEFATWLLRIVANECLMFIRGKRRARFVYLDDTSRQPDGAPVELPACGPDPEGELRLCELKQALKTEIRRVPPLLRNVIMLRDIQELPMKDVAETLNIGVPAAKSRLLRGRTELRARLVRRCENIESLSALSRSAAPLNRVAHHRAMHPVLTTDS
jgi:RNA polymerase sigma-70 factor (ECF subfamily)